MRAVHTLVLGLEAVAEALLRFVAEGARMREDAAKRRALPEKRPAEPLGRQAQRDRLPGLGNHAVADQAVEAEAGNVEHVGRRNQHVAAAGVLHAVHEVRLSLVVPHPIGRDAVRGQRPERDRAREHVPLDLGVAVAPRERVRLHGLARDHRTHLRIELVVEHSIEFRVVVALFAAPFDPFQVFQRQGGDVARDDRHGRPEGRIVERREFADADAGGGRRGRPELGELRRLQCQRPRPAGADDVDEPRPPRERRRPDLDQFEFGHLHHHRAAGFVDGIAGRRRRGQPLERIDERHATVDALALVDLHRADLAPGVLFDRHVGDAPGEAGIPIVGQVAADDQRFEQLRRLRQPAEALRHFLHQLVAEVALQLRHDAGGTGLVDANAADPKFHREDRRE